MGGWKFTIFMGGDDPSTGEVSVFNWVMHVDEEVHLLILWSYHVGELESGAQFDQTYTNFDVVQAAFLTFIKDALGMSI
jgi:hypothetical protein